MRQLSTRLLTKHGNHKRRHTFLNGFRLGFYELSCKPRVLGKRMLCTVGQWSNPGRFNMIDLFIYLIWGVELQRQSVVLFGRVEILRRSEFQGISGFECSLTDVSCRC